MNTTKLGLKNRSVKTLKRCATNAALTTAITLGTAGAAFAGYDVNARIDAL